MVSGAQKAEREADVSVLLHATIFAPPVPPEQSGDAPQPNLGALVTEGVGGRTEINAVSPAHAWKQAAPSSLAFLCVALVARSMRHWQLKQCTGFRC